MDKRNIAYFVRLRIAFEKSLFRSFKKLYNKQGEEIATQYLMNGIDGAISAVNQGDLEVQELMSRFYEKVIGTMGLAQLKQMIRKQQKKKEAFPESSRFVMLSKQWIADNILSQSELVTGTSVKVVERSIQNGISNGLGEKPIAKNIRDSFSGTIANHRARTIARTETGNASSYAQELGAKESGLEFVKEWIPVDDGATRQGHSNVTPNRIGMDEKFVVNGEYLDRPNDPNGSASNVINCRCICGYDPILE